MLLDTLRLPNLDHELTMASLSASSAPTLHAQSYASMISVVIKQVMQVRDTR